MRTARAKVSVRRNNGGSCGRWELWLFSHSLLCSLCTCLSKLSEKQQKKHSSAVGISHLNPCWSLTPPPKLISKHQPKHYSFHSKVKILGSQYVGITNVCKRIQKSTFLNLNICHPTLNVRNLITSQTFGFKSQM